MFQIDKQQHQTCSWRGTVVPAAVFVLQMARDQAPRPVAASQYISGTTQQTPPSSECRFGRNSLCCVSQTFFCVAERQLQNLLCNFGNSMAHANPRSWAYLAVDIPTGHVEYGAKLVSTKVVMVEDAVVDVQRKTDIAVVTRYSGRSAKEGRYTLIHTIGSGEQLLSSLDEEGRRVARRRGLLVQAQGQNICGEVSKSLPSCVACLSIRNPTDGDG